MKRRQFLKKARRIVVKVGSTLLTDEQGRLKNRFMSKLAKEIAILKSEAREIILVSSGAIAAGLQTMKKNQRLTTIPAKQAMAAIGQPRLMQAYNRAFAKYNLVTAQVLLTSDDIHDRERYAHARDALFELLKQDVVPIFNENDTVAVNEIKFGSNDILSAHITNLAEADVLILLTDVAGFYTNNPRTNKQAELILTVDKIDQSIKKMAAGRGSILGTGGMCSKIMAAENIVGMGEEMIIADGRIKDVLPKLINGEVIGTIFYPQGDKPGARKSWIAYSLKPKGRLYLDQGATVALKERGKSLLPSGVKKAEGKFVQGDCVELIDHQGRTFARGLIKYDDKSVQALTGVKSSDIEKILGYKNSDELIHRNDMALLK